MPPAKTPSSGDPQPGRRPRGERLWHTATDAIFLVSGQRRLLYANPAWEKVTGAVFAEARGRVCRRRSNASDLEPVERVLAALAPPPEALAGRPCQIRRRAPARPLEWWDIDYFPWSDADGLQAIVGSIRVIQECGPVHAAIPEKIVQLRRQFYRAFGLDTTDTVVPALQRLTAQIRLAAQNDLPALLLGPPGSGKEWTARTIHHLSHRTESFFAVIDARLPTGALADLLSSVRHWNIGTLYVKDPERLPRDLQSLLLQKLRDDSSEVPPRLLAGSSANLDEEQRAGRLLPEFFAAVSALTIQVPTLRERIGDLPRLIERMLQGAATATGAKVSRVSPAALERLRMQEWPNHLAELYATLVQACRRARSEQIEVEDLPFAMRGVPAPPDKPLPLDETLTKVERRMIELALRLARDNKSSAAELLAIWRQRLVRRMEQLGLATSGNDNDKTAD